MIKTFQDLLDIAGGAHKLCFDFNLHPITVKRWSKKGFPDKYITPLCQKYKISPIELRKLQKKLKAK